MKKSCHLPEAGVKKRQLDEFEKMCRAVNHYLRTFGWNMVVSGPVYLERDPLAAKFKHRFVLEFVGAKRERSNG